MKNIPIRNACIYYDDSTIHVIDINDEGKLSIPSKYRSTGACWAYWQKPGLSTDKLLTYLFREAFLISSTTNISISEIHEEFCIIPEYLKLFNKYENQLWARF